LNFNYRVSELQFNVTPPPTVTTTSAPDDVYNTSQLSLVIDKADSIEEEKEEIVHGSVRHKKTFSCDDIVIEEEAPASSSESIESSRIRKISVVAMEKQKSFEMEEKFPKQQSQPFEALQLPPTTTSTQTVPTEEFPEVSVTSTAINQADDVGENAQFKEVETQQDTKIAQEIDMKAIEMRNYRSRSINERDAFGADDSAKSSKFCEQQKQSFLAHQQSMSQEADDEVAMVSGLLPGCVAPAPTPAPSIAPLAEIEVDPTEDDIDAAEQEEFVEPKPEAERKKKRKEKRDKDGEAQGEADSSDPDKSKRNAVCPWEDE
jgi:hypothetical protein